MPRTGDTYNLPAGGAVAGTEAKANDVVTPLADLAAEQNLVRPISAGGTGASTTSAARAALGLAIGSNVQAYDAGLASVAGLTTAADKMIYTTAADTYAVTDLTSFARTLLDDADAAAVLTTLGVTAFMQTLLDDADAATAGGTLGLVIGTDVQAHDASLDDLAGITFAAGDILYHDGTNLQKLAKGTDGQVATLVGGVPAWADVAGIGVGQTWEDVKASRSAGTSYRNTTGRPIMVQGQFNSSTVKYFQVSADGSTWITQPYAISSVHAFVWAIIPHNHYYKIDTGTDISSWTELR